MVIWKMSDASVVCVEAVITLTPSGWHGQLFGSRAPTAEGPDVRVVREKLAVEVWKLIQNGTVSVPIESVARVRIYAHTAFEYPRQGEHSGAPVTVQAVADRASQGWSAAPITPHTGLGAVRGEAEDFHGSREDLAVQLLMALEVGVETVPADWSGLTLVMQTRKSYDPATL